MSNQMHLCVTIFILTDEIKSQCEKSFISEYEVYVYECL